MRRLGRTDVGSASAPQIFRTERQESIRLRKSPTGDVGLLYAGEGIEAVWVSKGAEKIDRRWFRYPRTDLLVVLKGRLRVDFRRKESPSRVLGPGDVLVLPPGAACRAYRWPRSAARPTVFFAVYRTGGDGRSHR